MTEIKNTRVYGLEEAIKRSGYPTRWGEPEDFELYIPFQNDSGISYSELEYDVKLTEQDWKRAKNLCRASLNSGHSNFLTGITVQFDIRMPLYMLKQWQRYHFQQIISSQSSMHTITKRKDIYHDVNEYVDAIIINRVNQYIKLYNDFEKNKSTNYNHPGDTMFKEAFNMDKVPTVMFEGETLTSYDIFMRIVSNLPSGFMLWQGVSTNYLSIATMYHQRKNHKLKEDWGVFCKWAEELPYFKELVLGGKEND